MKIHHLNSFALESSLECIFFPSPIYSVFHAFLETLDPCLTVLHIGDTFLSALNEGLKDQPRAGQAP
jgi:hypothetical protein